MEIYMKKIWYDCQLDNSMDNLTIENILYIKIFKKKFPDLAKIYLNNKDNNFNKLGENIRDGIESNLIFERYLCPSCLEYELNIYRSRNTLYLCECQNCGKITVGLDLNEVLEGLKIID
jgi:hypothetical protein